MKTGRSDLDARVRVSSIPDEEPTFLVRGRDPAGGVTVRAYVVAAHGLGAPAAVLEQALKQADRMETWPHKKLVDAGHLTPDEVKQLEYEFSRRSRAYVQGPFLAEEPVMFARRVGHDEAAGQARALKAQARWRLFQAREALAEGKTATALERLDEALTILGSGE